MNKRAMISSVILIAYCVPYVFLGMYADAIHSSMLLYGFMIAAMLALGWYCGKTRRIPIALLGNLLSFLSSCLLTQMCFGDAWDYYFKAFPATIRTAQFSGIMLVVQVIPWWFSTVTS